MSDAPNGAPEPPAPADELQELCERVRTHGGALAVTLTDGAGRVRAHAGEVEAEPAAPPAAGEPRRAVAEGGEHLLQLHDGTALLSVAVGGAGMLVVRFDARTSLGLVRLRVRQALPELERLLAGPPPDGGSPPPPAGADGGAPPVAAMADVNKPRPA